MVIRTVWNGNANIVIISNLISSRLECQDGWGQTYKIYPDDFKSATNTFEYRHSDMSILSAAKNL